MGEPQSMLYDMEEVQGIFVTMSENFYVSISVVQPNPSHYSVVFVCLTLYAAAIAFNILQLYHRHG